MAHWQLLAFSVYVALVAWAAARSGSSSRTLLLPQAPQPLVAVADLHGDYTHGLLSLRLTGCVDEEGHWIGGTSHLVQTGDVVDRGPHSVDLLQLLWRLRDEAAAVGGRVTLLWGNHEVWAVSGTSDYASAEELERLGGRDVWNSRFSLSGDLGRVLAETHVAAAVVGEGPCRTLFVHAGLGQRFLGGHTGDAAVEQLNARLRRALEKSAQGGALNPGADAQLFGEKGPFWLRYFALGPAHAACAEVENVLTAVNATRMVVGHTVQPGGPRSRCDGALVLLDAGISSAYYGRGVAWMCGEEGAAVVEETGTRGLPVPRGAQAPRHTGARAE